MINLNSISFSGYKSFEDQVKLNGIGNVNLVIGKNNSGKSSVLDVIENIFNKNLLLQKQPKQIILEQTLTKEIIERAFSKNTSGGDVWGNHYDFGKQFINKQLFYSIERFQQDSLGDTTQISNRVERIFALPEQGECEFKQAANILFVSLPSNCTRKIAAERNIAPEEQNKGNVKSNGEGATSIICSYINNSQKDEKIVEKELLNAFNEILGEDAYFESIKVQQITNREGSLLWEIFLTENGNRYALSRMGSGLKTILLVLINLLICAKEENTKIFFFEELENNLHPALQRRLFSYIYNYAIEHDIVVFLTSHSHVSINCYYSKASTNIYHVEKLAGKSTIKKIDNYIDKSKLLNDLDVRASDLLQSNGVIWVEGPSDRVYIKKWISLLSPELIENEHYQFVYYGGKLLAHYSMEPNTEDLISILLTNRNSVIVIDSDKRKRSDSINDTKKRIQEEFAKMDSLCWITKGKEIENYSISRYG